MRRLIAILAASAMLLSSVGTVAAETTPQRTLAKGQRVVISASRNVVQGGKAWMTVKITRCDRTQLKNYSVSASSAISGTVTLNRVGVVRNAGSHSKSCVWRGTFKVAADAPLGAQIVTFSVSSTAGAMTLANSTRTMTVRAPESTAGTDHTSGS